MIFQILAIWGCMPELGKNCVDMTNASSTYLSIVIGMVVGAAISWWIYHRQKKISEKQDEVQRHIEQLGESHKKVLESHEKMLETISGIEKHHENVLNEILGLNKKIDSVIEKMTTK
jgi:hypothetical protein